jgi:hypothetical protein
MSEPISPAYKQEMNLLAHTLDRHFNKPDNPKKVAFVLLLTEFDNMQGRVNYISNGKHADIVVMLKEVLARFEGQPAQRGTA